jgi:hypothetical protein
MRTFLIFISVALLTFACKSPKPAADGEMVESTDLITGQVTHDLYSYDKADTVKCSIEYMYYKKTSLPYQDKINRIIKGFVESGVTFGSEVEQENATITEKYMSDVLQRFADEYNQEMEINEGGGGIWETETMIEITEYGSDYAVLSLSNWNYSGGAHGNGWSEERIIDMKTGEELLLADFVSDVAEFTRIAEKAFRTVYEIPEDGDLGDAGFMFDDGVFTLNENFLFNENSVEFMFNTYEIAAYVVGPIFVSVPMSEVKHLLKRKVY